MKKQLLILIKISALLALALVITPLSARGQSEGSAETRDIPQTAEVVVSGDVDDSPMIAINADNVPLGDALRDVCRKARWGLVLDADASLLAQQVTVLLPQKKPAVKVLEMLIAQKGLAAKLSDGVLRITAIPKPAQAAPQPTQTDTTHVKTQVADTDSKDIVINDLARLKDFKDTLKQKFNKHKHSHSDDDDGIERVEMGAPVTIEKAETVSKAVSMGDNVTILGKVENEAVAVGGDVIVEKGATVGSSAAAVGGNVLVKKGATVNGEVVAVGGRVTVEDGATVAGDRVSVNIPIPAISGVAGVLGMGAMFWVVAAILRSFLILAVALIIVWIAPDRVAIAKDYLVQKTGWSLLSGLLILIGTVPAIVFLAITIIGAPLIPFLILLLIAIVIFGLAAMLLWLGNWIPLFKSRKSPTLAIVIGFLVFLIINMIPVVGGIFLLLASLAAAGATFLSRFGKQSRAL